MRLIACDLRPIFIVASNTPSAFIAEPGFREKYLKRLPGKAFTAALSPLMFGDGAGAIVISAGKSDGHAKLLASTFGADTLAPLMHYRGGGASAPTNPDTTVLHRYEIDAIEVAAHFGKLLGKAIHDLKAIHDFKLYDIQRFYFHQANLRLVEKFADEIGIPMSKVAVNVDRYGNTAAASTLILLDEDVRWGRIQQGDLCLLAAMGAGAHYGAALIRW